MLKPHQSDMMLTKAKFCLVNELLGCFARYCHRVGGQNWPFKMFKREGSEKWPPRAFSLCSRNPEANEVKCGSFILKNSGQVQVADVNSAVAKNPRSMFEGHVLQSSSFSTPHSVHQRFYSFFFFFHPISLSDVWPSLANRLHGNGAFGEQTLLCRR